MVKCRCCNNKQLASRLSTIVSHQNSKEHKKNLPAWEAAQARWAKEAVDDAGNARLALEKKQQDPGTRKQMSVLLELVSEDIDSLPVKCFLPLL